MSMYISLMTRRNRVVYYALTVLWLISVTCFFGWWFQPEHFVSVSGMAFNTALLCWTTLLPAWFLFFVGRARKINPSLPIPAGRVAMITTKVPSEPFDMVVNTLTHMLAQKWPHDTWLADENPTAEMLSWCRQNSVFVSCRQGISEYNRPDWPGRAKTKEGNLRCFYETCGYESYDFVVQMDADHVPESGYLSEILRPFNDEKVGYVAVPSICDRNIGDSWAAKARADAEATLHGALQAGYNDGFVPMCIGSHYAVRTVALKKIGGLGPELAEDHSTTLLMSAEGWRGAFAIDAIAHGDGPSNFCDAATQERQWARSLMTIFYELTPKCLGKLNNRLKFQFLFSQLWYPMTAIVMLLSYLLPVIVITGQEPLVRVGYIEFLLHFIPTIVVCLLIVKWLKNQGLTRPSNASILSWQALLFQMVRWPYILAGCMDATVAMIARRRLTFKVTPKGKNARPLPKRSLLPYISVSAISGVVTFLGSHGKSIEGYYYLLASNCIMYMIVTVLVIILHVRESK